MVHNDRRRVCRHLSCFNTLQESLTPGYARCVGTQGVPHSWVVVQKYARKETLLFYYYPFKSDDYFPEESCETGTSQSYFNRILILGVGGLQRSVQRDNLRIRVEITIICEIGSSLGNACKHHIPYMM